MKGEKQLQISVLLPPDLAEAVKSLGSMKARLLDQLASALESGDVTIDQLPQDPIKCLKGSKPKTVILRVSKEGYGILKRFAESSGSTTSSLIRRLVAWFIGYECG